MATAREGIVAGYAVEIFPRFLESPERILRAFIEFEIRRQAESGRFQIAQAGILALAEQPSAAALVAPWTP